MLLQLRLLPGRTHATHASETYPIQYPSEVFDEVKKKVERIRETQQNVDYISIVPDGEPTLDSSLGELIERLKELGLPVAVITNSSLTWDKSVQEDLKKAELGQCEN